MTAFTTSAALLNTPLMKRGLTKSDLPYLTDAGAGGSISKIPSVLEKLAKRYHRNPNPEKSTKLRRSLGGKSWSLPDKMCELFTEGQRAVLHVIANVVKQNGYCDWCVEKIAYQAGVSIRLMQYTIKKAKSLGFLSIQYRRLAPNRNDTNIIRLVSSEWKTWLKRIRKDWRIKQGCKEVHAMKDKNIKNSKFEENESLSVRAEALRYGLLKGKRPDD